MRWDSLRLFTPARFDGLAGMPFPAPDHTFPTKNEMADFLETYAAHFQLPVRTGTGGACLARGRPLMVRAAGRVIEAENVVIAMASYQAPRIPKLASSLRPDIVQMHSLDYRNLGQLRQGGVLIVGGNWPVRAYLGGDVVSLLGSVQVLLPRSLVERLAVDRVARGRDGRVG